MGSLKPNDDLGLFDVQGNVYTWCQESFLGTTRNTLPGKKGRSCHEDREDDLVIENARSRVLRGGSFLSLASFVRSAFRDYWPALRNLINGFRPARTFR